MFERASENERCNRAFAIVTIIAYNGTVPRKDGRMLVFSDGSFSGTIGGGEGERIAIKEAMAAILDGKGRTLRLAVKKGGEIEVHIDIPVKDRRVYLVGSGHIAKATAEIFFKLGWRISIIDTHPIDESSFPPLTLFTDADISRAFKKADINKNSAIILTDPERASLLLPEFIMTDAFYIGILTSRKWKLDTNDRRVHAPIGLSIGAETPEEIALSIASEVFAAFKRSSARPSSKDGIVVIRGAGDLATGVAVRLFKAGYRIVMLDISRPTVIRRTVSFAEAFYEGECIVEGVKGVLANSFDEAKELSRERVIPLLVDPECKSIESLKPVVLIDAIIAKRNLGTNRAMAPFTVALGPGFTAGLDVDVVIETKRGHYLGSLIREGQAIANSGIPGIIAGYGKERVIHAEAAGIFKGAREIGDIVKKGDIVAYIDDVPVKATIDGKLRGLLHSGLYVPVGFKVADIDPRGEEAEHRTISDKARAIGGGVLEAVDSFMTLV